MSNIWGGDLSNLLLLLYLWNFAPNTEGRVVTINGTTNPNGIIPDTDNDYHIVSDVDHQIQLNFQHITNSTHKRSRAFEILNGGGVDDRDPVLARGVVGSDVPPWIASSKNEIYLKFIPGSSGLVDVVIIYHVIACVMEKTIEAHSGLIKSLGYPMPLLIPQCATWVIDSPNSVITISFDDLDLPKDISSSSTCVSDYVEIGPDPPLTFCGQIYNNRTRTYRSVRDHLWIKYRYSGSSRGRGFALRYLAGTGEERSCNPGEYLCRGGGCVLDHWRCNGVDDCNDGSDEQACNNPQTTTSTLKYTTNTTPVPTRYPTAVPTTATTTTTPWFDDDGQHSSSLSDCYTPQLGERLLTCMNLHTRQPCLEKVFWCDGNVDCMYAMDELPELCYGMCNRTLHATNTTTRITSPNFPNPYSPSTHCTYTLVAPPGGHVVLTFHSLSLGLHSYAQGNRDALVIYDIGGERETLLASFQGSVLPPPEPISSISNTMIVLFTSDHAMQDTGFNASFVGVDCGNEIYRTDRRGQIQSPNYPQISTSHVCKKWTIHGLSYPINGVLTFSFQHIDLPSTNESSCPDNYILLGPDPVKRLCGHITKPVSYISFSDRVTILYNYQGNKAGRGFSLDYIVSNKQSGDCPDTMYTCDAPYRHCILDRWRCNGAAECPDGSDEAGCTSIRPIYDSTPYYGCPAGMSRCLAPDGSDYEHCILSKQWCDGTPDCQGATDEQQENCDKECSTSLEGPTGVILSPMYPARYPARPMNCKYFIHVRAGRTIQLRPVDFSLNSNDALKVYDGADESAALLLAAVDDRGFPSLLTSSSNRLFLLFVTDAASSGYGFNITFQETGECLPDQSPCLFGEDDCYLAPTQRCDGVWQCENRGGDERGCRHCQADMFPCGMSATQCYHIEDRCTGLGHCLEKDDEENCTATLCGSHNGTFLCDNGRCIYESWWCDGAKDCQDGSDEQGCPGTPSVNVITAAVMGSLICGWLVVLALACARRLHLLRNHARHAGAAHHLLHPSSSLLLPSELQARRRAPPLYDEAMATSLPYDVVVERERQRRASGENNGNITEGAIGTDGTDGNTNTNATSSSQSQGAQNPLLSVVNEMEAIPEDVAAEEVELVMEEEEESLTLTPTGGVQWRRNSQSQSQSQSQQPKLFTRRLSSSTSTPESLLKSDDDVEEDVTSTGASCSTSSASFEDSVVSPDEGETAESSVGSGSDGGGNEEVEVIAQVHTPPELTPEPQVSTLPEAQIQTPEVAQVQMHEPQVQPPKPQVPTPSPQVHPPKPQVQPPKPQVQPTKPQVQAPKPQVQPTKPELPTPTPPQGQTPTKPELQTPTEHCDIEEIDSPDTPRREGRGEGNKEEDVNLLADDVNNDRDSDEALILP